MLPPKHEVGSISLEEEAHAISLMTPEQVTKLRDAAIKCLDLYSTTHWVPVAPFELLGLVLLAKEAIKSRDYVNRHTSECDASPWPVRKHCDGSCKEQAETNRLRVALKECGRFGYWGKNTSRETLIETLDHITTTANAALEEPHANGT